MAEKTKKAQIFKRGNAWWNNRFYTILIAVALIGGGCAFFIPPFITSYGSGDSLPILRQTILAATGGVLAILTLWENRRKNDQEHMRQVHAERRSRYATAIEQLADEKAPIRLGGVYTLVKLVDEWLADEKTLPSEKERREEGQAIINSLCAYIRSPFDLTSKSKVLSENEVPESYESGIQQFAKDQARFREEKELRLTILDAIKTRLNDGTITEEDGTKKLLKDPWSDFDYDFSNARFFYPINFASSYFGASTKFTGAEFAEYANFSGARFAEDADFNGAEFTEGANFFVTVFTEYADFSEARFTEADFNGAIFPKYANFSRSKFTEYANFSEARFTQQARFNGARFAENADFNGAEFTEDADFLKATFAGNATFFRATFAGNANFFRGVFFIQDANFSGAKFTQNASFSGAIFAQNADFSGAKFTQNASFSRATFEEKPIFESALGNEARFSCKVEPENYNFEVSSESPYKIETWDPERNGIKFTIPKGATLFDPNEPSEQEDNDDS